MNSKWNIYVLKLECGKYYVGKTKRGLERINEHISGTGSSWTLKYKPIELIEFVEGCDAFDEDKYTLQYMNLYGIENVRGGSYTQIQLDAFTLNHINNQLISANDLCYKCGKSGHFLKDCPLFVKSKTEQCFNCKEYGHIAKNCNKQIECHKCHKVGHISANCTSTLCCFRCGRDGHYSSDCYSKIHIDGHLL